MRTKVNPSTPVILRDLVIAEIIYLHYKELLHDAVLIFLESISDDTLPDEIEENSLLILEVLTLKTLDAERTFHDLARLALLQYFDAAVGNQSGVSGIALQSDHNGSVIPFLDGLNPFPDENDEDSTRHSDG